MNINNAVNPPSRSIAAACLLILAGFHPFAAQAQVQTTASTCQLTKEAELPLVERYGRFLVEAEINGAKRLFVVDSGSEKSALAPDAADALKLPRDGTSAERLNGPGGALASQYPRTVDSFRLGPAQWTNLTLPTASAAAFTRFAEPNLAGILGADMLSRYDVELDFPAHTMTLYTAQNCLGRFVPWHGEYQALSPEYTPRHRFLMAVALNGHPVRAVLGTGAGRSLVGGDAARRVGIDDAMLAQDRATSGQGVGGVSFATYDHRFDTVQIGTLVFKNARVEIGDTAFPRNTDMLLGMDFMKWRRVWLSYSTGWVFMQRDAAQGNATQGNADLAATEVASSAAVVPLDAPAQLQTIFKSGVAWSGLPSGPIPQFSSHSHMTYRMVPHLVEAPRLSPQALPQGSMPGQ